MMCLSIALKSATLPDNISHREGSRLPNDPSWKERLTEVWYLEQVVGHQCEHSLGLVHHRGRNILNVTLRDLRQVVPVIMNSGINYRIQDSIKLIVCSPDMHGKVVIANSISNIFNCCMNRATRRCRNWNHAELGIKAQNFPRIEHFLSFWSWVRKYTWTRSPGQSTFFEMN